MGVGPTSNGAEVTVVTGTDFSVSAPASSGAPTTSGAAASTPTASSAVLAAPTPPKQSLAAFDPRSCTASGSAGP